MADTNSLKEHPTQAQPLSLTYPHNPVHLPWLIHLPTHLGMLRSKLTWPIHLTHASLDCVRKPEHLQETHTDTGRMYKLHTDNHPRLESNLGPWHCATMPSLDTNV